MSALKVKRETWPGAVKLDAAPPPGPVTPCRSMLCGIFDVGHVAQVELDRVALAHADEAARHGAAEGPEGVGDAFGDRHLLLDDVELDDHLRRRLAPGGGRHLRRRGQHGLDRLALRRAEVALARAAGVAGGFLVAAALAASSLPLQPGSSANDSNAARASVWVTCFIAVPSRMGLASACARSLDPARECRVDPGQSSALNASLIRSNAGMPYEPDIRFVIRCSHHSM